MAVLATAYGPAPVGFAGALGVYLARGMMLSGLPNDSSLGWMFDDFIQEGLTLSGWNPFVSNSGALATVVAGSGSGIIRLSTGATANSIAAESTTPGAVSNVSTARWYHASRFRITTTPDANTIAAAGLLNLANSKSLLCGFNGSLNPTQFALQTDGNFTGTSTTFGVAVDTAFHVFEMYGQGSAVARARLDGGAEISMTQVSAPADALFTSFQVRNGATAANQVLEMDWVLTMGARV